MGSLKNTLVLKYDEHEINDSSWECGDLMLATTIAAGRDWEKFIYYDSKGNKTEWSWGYFNRDILKIPEPYLSRIIKRGYWLYLYRHFRLHTLKT